jgi:hypothetical protein
MTFTLGASRRAALLAACLLMAAPALAHGPKGTKLAGANGGEVADVEGGHLEFVVTPTEVQVFLTDMADANLDSAAASGRAIIQSAGQQSIMQLTPRAPNALVAPLAAPLAKDAVVAVSATFTKGGKPVQARFVVK